MRSLYWQVYEVLRDSKAIDVNDLYSVLKRRIQDLTRRELDDVLLKMESAGFISVIQVTRDQKRVEFVEHRAEAVAQEAEAVQGEGGGDALGPADAPADDPGSPPGDGRGARWLSSGCKRLNMTLPNCTP
ncbi:MAG: hypothetical protein RXQ62_03370 [Nitrososphaeria archaeon]